MLLPIAYVLDTGFHVFFWVGKEASSQMRTRGFAQAKVGDSLMCMTMSILVSIPIYN